jgi:hypothetical protein
MPILLRLRIPAIFLEPACRYAGATLVYVQHHVLKKEAEDHLVAVVGIRVGDPNWQLNFADVAGPAFQDTRHCGDVIVAPEVDYPFAVIVKADVVSRHDESDRMV